MSVSSDSSDCSHDEVERVENEGVFFRFHKCPKDVAYRCKCCLKPFTQDELLAARAKQTENEFDSSRLLLPRRNTKTVVLNRTTAPKRPLQANILRTALTGPQSTDDDATSLKSIPKTPVTELEGNETSRKLLTAESLAEHVDEEAFRLSLPARNTKTTVVLNRKPIPMKQKTTWAGRDAGGDTEWNPKARPPRKILGNKKQKLEIYTCETCQKTFKKNESLEAHIENVHPIGELVKKETSPVKTRRNTRTKIETNEKTSEKEELIVADKTETPDADSESETSRSRNASEVEEGQQELIKCPVCERSFGARGSLKRHLSTVHINSKGLFQCNRCQKTYRVAEGLAEHQKSHAPRDSFKCKECQKGFSLQKYLNAHVRYMHGKDNPFKCDQCDSGFKTKVLLMGHKSKLHDKRLYTCEICDKKFPSSFRLKKHMELDSAHDDVKSHVCEVCGDKFDTKPKLKKHYPNCRGKTNINSKKNLNPKRKIIKNQPKEVLTKEKNGNKNSVCPVRKSKNVGKPPSKRGRKPATKVLAETEPMDIENYDCYVCGEHFTEELDLNLHISAAHMDDA